MQATDATTHIYVSRIFLKKRELASFLIEVHTSQGFLDQSRVFVLHP
jgi:hypothetical protein